MIKHGHTAMHEACPTGGGVTHVGDALLAA
jgi:hypothetical protein